MNQCSVCGLGLVDSEKAAGVCFKCETQRQRGDVRAFQKANQERLDSIILTTETSPDFVIKERLGIITAECVFGTNVFRDFFTGFRDVFGGRSKAMQKVLRDARKVVLNELREEAFELGADAVISTRLEYSQMSGHGTQLLFIAAVGTAITITR